MKSTGVVRRVDDLGRIVIPKEIRRTLRIRDEDKSYVGKPFKVIGRCEEGKEWDLESLPAWKIEFEDGHKMDAYNGACRKRNYRKNI